MDISKSIFQDYALIHWIVYTFLGGAINTLALQIFVDFYSFVNSEFTINLGRTMKIQELFYYFSIPLVIMFFIPIILSLFLTKFHPEKRIVPP